MPGISHTGTIGEVHPLVSRRMPIPANVYDKMVERIPLSKEP
jgi:hypothetical protein